MFEAKLSSAGTMKKIIDAIKDLLTDAQWDCRESGLSLQAMDSSHVALVSVKLNADGFEEYRCDYSMALGMNISNMNKIIRSANNDDTLIIRANDDADSVFFILESPKEERFSQYSLKLMDLDTEHLGIPDTMYNCVVTMSSSEFSRICRDMMGIGESLTITCRKNGITFSSKGDIGTGRVRLVENDIQGAEVSVDLRDACSVQFASKYMNHFAKAAPLSSKVTLSLSNDMPIAVEFVIENIGYVRYYLAPKLDDESEVKTEDMD